MRISQKTLLALAISFLISRWAVAEPIRVKYLEGTLHGFMVLRNQDGKQIGTGGVDQTVQKGQVTVNLKLHFDDGSDYEESTVFSQRGVFRVLSNHLLQKGPSFKKPMEVWIDCAAGQVKVRDMKDGEDKISTNHINIPADLANGIAPTVIKNFPDDSQRTLTILAATPKPRIVKLVVTPEGEETFSFDGAKYKAKHYRARIEIGGVAGAVAPVIGQQPPDSQFWILKGEAPIFLRSMGPLSAGSPVWQIELAGPIWGREQK
jgi:hypothetical protein